MKKHLAVAALMVSSMGVSAAVSSIGAVTGTYNINNGSGSVSQGSVESFLGLAGGTLDTLGQGNATEGSAIKDSLSVSAGSTLSFNWFWTSGEGNASGFNDFAFVTINVGGTTVVANTFTADNTSGSFSFVMPSAGTLSYGIGVMDVGDSIVDSFFNISNLSVTAGTVPEPGSMLLAGLGLLGAAAARRRAVAR